ncbi:COX15/CtaA family protein [Reichenbachiella sp. MALMAid0571]|uniref:COX15/CtaA family protein n=1 Tax=Reichenbachiella sp. MALMAid0571 TaxID=3143939 RepID=UPI0032DF725E
MTAKPIDRLYTRLNLITIIAVYLLIMVGGIVRSTGSGMGCPDWPKCFGNYLPPTDVSELPENYKEIYSQKRHEKNLRVASMMRTLGMENLAGRITNDNSILIEQTFNPTKTWVEYVNRIVGVLVGLFILSGFIKSFSYWSHNRKITILSFCALLLVSFQGWIGSIVVSTNLLPGMITFHMLLAIGLIALLLYIRFDLQENRRVIDKKRPKSVKGLLIVCIILLLTQIVLGTQVREAIDTIAAHLGETSRVRWIDNLGLTFYLHRTYSLVILTLHIILLIRLFRTLNLVGTSVVLSWSLILLILLEIVTGAILVYFALPYLIQPIHLFLALLIFGIQYYLLLIVNESSNINKRLANAN